MSMLRYLSILIGHASPIDAWRNNGRHPMHRLCSPVVLALFVVRWGIRVDDFNFADFDRRTSCVYIA